jgi:O-methyltransferase
MYGSTFVCLEYMYPKLAVGGYCTIDDYGATRMATDAVNDYREQMEIEEPINWIETESTDMQRWGVFWRKEK